MANVFHCECCGDRQNVVMTQSLDTPAVFFFCSACTRALASSPEVSSAAREVMVARVILAALKNAHHTSVETCEHLTKGAEKLAERIDTFIARIECWLSENRRLR